jgi:transcriptional regulator with XRE-family HTH domain
VAGTNPTAPQVGTAIRELRRNRDLTLEDLAGIAEMHTTHLSDIELGKTNPGWEMLRSLANAFGIETSALVKLAETLAKAQANRARRAEESEAEAKNRT